MSQEAKRVLSVAARKGWARLSVYVYREKLKNVTGERRFEALPILRKTDDQVFVARHVFRDGTQEQRLDTLDRRRLEEKGRVTIGTGWGKRIY